MHILRFGTYWLFEASLSCRRRGSTSCERGVVQLSSTEKKIEKLALIVGGNPLPNYLAVQILQPKEILFFYTSGAGGPKDSERIMRHLQKALNDSAEKTAGHPGYVFHKQQVGHRAKAESIVAAVRRARSAHENIDHLHYSGGTKPMATHIHAELSKDPEESDPIRRALRPEQFSYMDEADGVLRYDNGTETSLDEANLNLNLAVLRTLHGIDTDQTDNTVDYFNLNTGRFPTRDDAFKIMSWLLEDVQPDMDEKIQSDKLRSKREKIKGDPKVIKEFIANRHVPDLSFYEHFGANFERETFANGTSEQRAWYDFLDNNGWFEHWTGYVMQDLLASDGSLEEIEVGRRYLVGGAYRCSGEGKPTEIDVAFLHNFRFHLISCTTSGKGGPVKQRLFEAITRAQQMGGELARPAVMCLQPAEKLEELRADAAATGIDTGAVGVFGLPHVRAVMNPEADESRSHINDLKNWLGIKR